MELNTLQIQGFEPYVRGVLACLRRLPNGSFQFCVHGAEGRYYLVESSSNLVDWVPFQTVIITNGQAEVLDSSVGLGQRFYRVR